MTQLSYRPRASSSSSHTAISTAPSGFVPATRDGLRHVEHVMGMPVMFEICDPQISEDVLAGVVSWLHWVDATFSTHRADSQISRLNRGELAAAQADPAVSEVLARCAELKRETAGFFDIEAPYRNGVAPAAGAGGPGSVEPSGYVKGWAIAGAAQRLHDAGARNFSVNAGGDAQLSGHPDSGERWRVGIQHPRLAGEIAMTLCLRDQAIATSGSYARGEHITDPTSGSRPAGLLSVTIVGPQIVTADAYATAAFAMGATRAAAFCAGLDGYEAVLIRDDDTVLTTPGIDALRGD